MVIGASFGSLKERLDTCVEWLLISAGGRTFPLERSEIDIETDGVKTILGFVSDKGYQSWRIKSFSLSEAEIEIALERRTRSVGTTVRLVPRTSAAELKASIETARLVRANEIATELSEALDLGPVRRVALADDNGRIAHIIFRSGRGFSTAVMADVTSSIPPEHLLAAALTWQEKLAIRKKDAIYTVWLAAEKRRARDLRNLQALLRPGIKERVRTVDLSAEPPRLLRIKQLAELWRDRPNRLELAPTEPSGPKVKDIIDRAPSEIDVVCSSNGQTVRYAGLPFMRIRTVAGRETQWFGVDRKKQILNDEGSFELTGLLADLGKYRSPHGANKRHELFRMAPEAWLESILRRNIKLLDANLILAPIYNQFRSAGDKIDLLALRKDGRLVIIELKASPDRNMVFQAAEYWRKVELQRRNNILSNADLFEGREILDKPSIVYLVAPAWSFHPDVAYFARMISKEIELWRFELHENWREDLKVVARRSYAENSSA